ncbi:PadR family transcriptional regulator [Methanogenium organophilum]|uniref:PadR family transcriptional regulator n=1 Tax=Methanogenium organophilum TaxID=2199 RepID=A0A9X9T6L5_METOG|nr:PadR family transcriptional regulator [Methanogenium organophilum]WAI00488.1 PadR family transcriptional regulator [Methanogenium organophilum]
MKGVLKFPTQDGHTRSLITLYVMHSLHREPKTGYDILREIDDVTKGEWVPSKGTLYPMLRHLADEGLITPHETGARAKTIYALTPDGEKTLAELKKYRHQSHENFRLLRTIHSDIFGKEFASLAEKMWEIRESVRDLPEDKHKAASEILDTCLSALRGLEEETEEDEGEGEI